jgi:hypothetical protein
MLALNKLVTADFYYVAQVGKVGLIAEVELAALRDIRAHRPVGYGIFGFLFKRLSLGAHGVLLTAEHNRCSYALICVLFN